MIKMKLMAKKVWMQGAVALIPAMLLIVTSCSSSSNPTNTGPVTSGAAYDTRAELGGAVVVDSVTRTDTVVSIDVTDRKLELKHPDGRIATYKAGPEVVNFNQLKAGDQVKATVVEETAVYLKPAGSPERVGASVVVTRAKTGATPGVKAVDTLSFTGKVMSTDPVQHQVTLQLVGGQTRTIRMNDFVNLADFNPGDDVSVRITESMVIAVEKL